MLLFIAAAGIGIGYFAGKNTAQTPDDAIVTKGGSILNMRIYLLNYFVEHATLSDSEKIKAVGILGKMQDSEMTHAYNYVANWVAKGQTPASNDPIKGQIKALNVKYGTFLV